MSNSDTKKHENQFKFGVYQNGSIVVERSFTADDYNPVVRYSVDIRERISDIISKLTKTMSRKSLTYIIYGYDNLDTYQDFYKGAKDYEDNKLIQPQIVSFKRGNTGEFNGAEFKFGLYINDHTIVERTFGVEGYNPASRFSRELSDVIGYIVEDITKHLKNTDINHMWDDYDIINIYNLTISQIRDLSKDKRLLLLKNKKISEFIKKIKKEYRVVSSTDSENVLEEVIEQ